MAKEQSSQHRSLNPASHIEMAFSILMLTIFIIGMFRPSVLTGIPVIWAIISWLTSIHIFAGFTGLMVAIFANMAYIIWRFSAGIKGRLRRIGQPG